MIKFFRKIRQNLLTENKFSKYILYAIGEIILVVIGILIALQLNTSKENKEKSDLGYKHLTEMSKEVQYDIFMLETNIWRLGKNIKDQETALNTKSMASLPLDSVLMIMNRPNMALNMSELTFNRMKNLGLTSLSNNDSLNVQINTYYNSSLVYFKMAMVFIMEKYNLYSNYLTYEQAAIDYTTENYEFPSLYSQSKQAQDSVNRINRINYITSIKGRNLILNELDIKKYALTTLSNMQEQSVKLLKPIYDDLKIQNPQIDPLPLLPTEIDFKEIEVSKELLKIYTGKYLSNSEDSINITLEDMHLYAEFGSSTKIEILPYEEDKFFAKNLFIQIEFNKENGEVTSFNRVFNGKSNYKKLD